MSWCFTMAYGGPFVTMVGIQMTLVLFVKNSDLEMRKSIFRIQTLAKVSRILIRSLIFFSGVEGVSSRPT